MLDETLIVMAGEFGRTPRVFTFDGAKSGKPGRDHWGAVQSVFFAGGGIRGGSVVGASDRQGGFPAADPHTPEDMAATIYSALGLPHTFLNLCFGGIGIVLEHSDARHHLTNLTITALWYVVFSPSVLHRVITVDRKTFDRDDFGLAYISERGNAGLHRLAIDVDRAGAAFGDTAAIFSSS